MSGTPSSRYPSTIDKNELRRFKQRVLYYRNHGSYQFQKEIEAFVRKVQWDWYPLKDKAVRFAWAHILYRTAARYEHVRNRNKQLDTFPLWVYRADPYNCPVHVELDGLCLPKDHLFWDDHLPPNHWECGCYVLGARNKKGAVRVGAKLERSAPVDWDCLDLVDTHFRSQVPPTVEETLWLLRTGKVSASGI